MSHTPGPWTHGEYAQRQGWWVKGVGDTIPLCTSQHTTPRSYANARLIAAAPALLATLERLAHEVLWITDQTDNGRLEAIERLHRDGTAIETARAAIAAARGKP